MNEGLNRLTDEMALHNERAAAYLDLIDEVVDRIIDMGLSGGQTKEVIRDQMTDGITAAITEGQNAIYAVDFMKKSEYAHVVVDDEVLGQALRFSRSTDPHHKRVADCIGIGEYVMKVGDVPKGDVTLLMVQYTRHNPVEDFLTGTGHGIGGVACYVIMLFEDSREAMRYKLAA